MTPPPDTPARAARLLVGGLVRERPEALNAVAVLRDAPPRPTWHRALVATLHHPDDGIREAGLHACLERLDRLRTTDRPAHNRFFGLLLDACIHLPDPTATSGHARLIRALTAVLRELPALDAEPLRSRFLARARDLQYLPEPGARARDIIRSQWWMATEDTARSDVQSALGLYTRRRLAAYSAADVSADAVLAYLEQDRRLAAVHVNGSLLAAYGRLLATHTRRDHGPVVLAALGNLDRWLADLPHTAEQRNAVTPDLVRARRNEPWDNLDRDAALHLAAHDALLPGPDHPDDLFVLLRTRYGDLEGEAVCLAGLRVLTHLPGLRGRIPEVIACVRQPDQRPTRQRALLDLVEGLWVDLPETGPDDDPDDAGIEAARLNRIARRRVRDLRRRLLTHDPLIRDLLTDLSREPDLPPDVRGHAWRILLRSGSPTRRAPFFEGLSTPGHPFFRVTLDVAGATLQRYVGPVLDDAWPRLVADTAGRRERLLRVCDVLSRLRLPPEATPHLLALGLDDPDTEVRRAAADAVHQAGHTAALERETQRRTLERLHDDLEQHAQQAGQLEDRLADLGRQITEHRARHGTLTHAIQTLTATREGLVAEGWTQTARMQAEAQTLQIELDRVLGQAQEHETLLHDVRRRLHAYQRSNWGLRRNTGSLTHQHETLLRDIDERRREADQARADARAARTSLDALLAEAPPDVNDEDERNRYLQERAHRIAALRETLAHHTSQADDLVHRRTLLEEDARRLTVEIEAAQVRAQHLDALHDEAATHERESTTLRQAIQRLEQDAHALRRQHDETHAERERRLAERERRLRDHEHDLADLDHTLHTLRDAVIETRDALDRCRTSIQQTTHDLDLGRRHYERLSARAAEESDQADRLADDEARALAARRRREQESLLWYAYNIEQALTRRPASTRPLP